MSLLLLITLVIVFQFGEKQRQDSSCDSGRADAQFIGEARQGFVLRDAQIHVQSDPFARVVGFDEILHGPPCHAAGAANPMPNNQLFLYQQLTGLQPGGSRKLT